jgi:hypothetical protein
VWSMVQIIHGICLTLSLRLMRPPPIQTASTLTIAPPPVSTEIPAVSSAQTDSRLLRLTTRLRANADRHLSFVMVSAWLQIHALRAGHAIMEQVRTNAGLAADLAPTTDRDG